MLSEIVKQVRGKDGEEPNNPPRQRYHQKREEGGGWVEAHDPPRQRGHQKRGSGGRGWLTMKLMVLRFQSPEVERRSFVLTTPVPEGPLYTRSSKSLTLVTHTSESHRVMTHS